VVYGANKPEKLEGEEDGYCSKTDICESVCMFSGKKEKLV
jgi:hypothetical protein